MEREGCYRGVTVDKLAGTNCANKEVKGDDLAQEVLVRRCWWTGDVIDTRVDPVAQNRVNMR